MKLASQTIWDKGFSGSLPSSYKNNDKNAALENTKIGEATKKKLSTRCYMANGFLHHNGSQYGTVMACKQIY